MDIAQPIAFADDDNRPDPHFDDALDRLDRAAARMTDQAEAHLAARRIREAGGIYVPQEEA